MRASSPPTGTVASSSAVMLEQDPGHGRRDLGVHLVGGHFHQGVVDLNRIADLLEPAGHRALGDRLAKLGHQHRRRGTPAGRRLGGCRRLGLSDRFGLGFRLGRVRASGSRLWRWLGSRGAGPRRLGAAL